MIEIKLPRGLSTLVDSEDYERLMPYKWSANPADQRRENWYVATSVKGKKLYMHRFILGAPKGMLVDHWNGNGLDNRRENIRLCTRSQNCVNRRFGYSPASGFRGVYLIPGGASYMARIWTGGKSTQLGYFATAAEAARAYDVAAFDRFGEFAVLNFPLRHDSGRSPLSE